MFPASYFGERYFAGRYWPKVGAIPLVAPDVVFMVDADWSYPVMVAERVHQPQFIGERLALPGISGEGWSMTEIVGEEWSEAEIVGEAVVG